MRQTRRLRIFTWHIHGSYLFYLSQGAFDIYIPRSADTKPGYWGRGKTFPFGANVIEIPAEEVVHLDFDLILFQDPGNFLADQYSTLSEFQRGLPKIYIEHNAPEPHPTDSDHIVNDPDVTVIHVTQFNRLMWNNHVPDVRVIEHGITGERPEYAGNRARGLVVVNHLFERGRKIGGDLVLQLQRSGIPIDWVGMGRPIHGGLGEILHPSLPAFLSQYRFFFNPVRHTSLSLSMLEAMMSGLPVISLATTEYASVIQDGVNGYCSNDPDYLYNVMRRMLNDSRLARRIGAAGKETAKARFNIDRFIADWEKLFYQKCMQSKQAVI